MSIGEEILRGRRITIFAGIKSQSENFGPGLLCELFPIPKIEKNAKEAVAIVPVSSLDKDFRKSTETYDCFGKAVRLIFVRSKEYNQQAFIFLTVSNSLRHSTNLSEEDEAFVQQTSCKQLALCDIGVLQKEDFFCLYRDAHKKLRTSGTEVCIVSVDGYEKRGSTDIETCDANEIANELTYWEKTNADGDYTINNINFVKVDRCFSNNELATICALQKDCAEAVLMELKGIDIKKFMTEGMNMFDVILGTRLKNETDITVIEDFLSKLKIKTAFDMIKKDWKETYANQCKQINNQKGDSKQAMLISFVERIKNDAIEIDKIINSL